MLTFALRSLLARRRRAALTGLAVLLGVAMVSGTFVFTDTINAAYRALFVATAKGADVVVGSRQGLYSADAQPASLPASLAGRIRGLQGVAAAQGQVSDVATIVGRNGQILKNSGSPTLAMSYLPPPFNGLKFVQGNPPINPAEVALDEATASHEGYGVGDRVAIVTTQPTRQFVISGIVRPGSGSSGGATFALFNLKTAQELFDQRGQLNTIYVAARAGTRAATLEREIAPLLPSGIAVQTTAREANADLRQVDDQLGVLTAGLKAFGFIAAFVGAFVIAGALSITLTQRTNELALLRALGATRRQVLDAVLVEAAAIGTLASVAGLFAGLGAAYLIRAVLRASGVEPPTTGLVLEPRTVLLAIAVGLVVTLAAGLVPAARATFVSPIEALRESRLPARPRLSAVLIGPVLFMALIGALFAFASVESRRDRITVSAIGAVLLVMAAMLLTPFAIPKLGRVAGWPLERGGRILGRLARENTTRTPVRTAVTGSSLMIGLALVLFVSVYVGGVRASTRTSIDHTVSADYAIVNRDGASPIPAVSARAVAGVPGVLAVSSIKRATADVAGAGQTTAAGIDPASIGQVYRFNWVGPQPLALADLGPGDVLLERDTARAAHLHVGQRVRVASPSGLGAALAVRGIYTDRALLPGVALPSPEFDQLFTQGQVQQVLVKLAPDAEPASTLAQIRSALSGVPGVVVRSERQLKDLAAGPAGSILALFYALLALTVVMAVLGIATATSLSIHERTPELGVLRALGMTRAQARRLIRDESLITAAIGTVVGAVLGIVIAWVVTRALTAEGVVFSIPWLQLALAIAVGLAVGVLAAVPAAARAARLDILSAIAHE
jgi:putative ABC transport system permease protein